MTTFAELYNTFDSDPVKRGKQFERFVKWFLTTDPRWATQVSRVWLWKDYPDRWGRDCGVDLVFKHVDGGTWAVQAKCYAPNYVITKPDIDKFLSETNRKAVTGRLLISTTDLLGPNARQVCEAQEKPIVRFLLHQITSSAVEYPPSITQLALGKRRPLPQPHPHQKEAVQDVVTGFNRSDRGQLLMACGTGKTLVTLWIKERLRAKRTLVLVPSLGLLAQTLTEWTTAAKLPFRVLCVCSDSSVGTRGEDEAVGSTAEVAFPVTSDISEIMSFLRKGDDQVIFATYQSSPVIKKAQQGRGVRPFDLIVADEAHRCAGRTDGAFALVLDSKKLRGTKRLFATATPRTYASSLKTRAEEIGVEVVSMDDESIFGQPLHKLSFGDAIRRSLLTDYRVVIVGVDDQVTADWIEKRLLVQTESGIETDAGSLAAEIGLIKAIEDWKLQRVISFHSRVNRANRFACELGAVWHWLDVSKHSARVLWSDHVSGEMPAISRIQKLQRLREMAPNEVGHLANARCLTEGVDVPALDGVAFIDAKRSQIDIVQAVGRAIRLSQSKTKGTIVIPVFAERNDDPNKMFASTNFKIIWQVLDALKAHDDVLSDELDQLRTELGVSRKTVIDSSDLKKIVIDLPHSIDASFARSLRSLLVVKTTESWLFWYGLLLRYVEKNGHARVPITHVTAEGYKLGKWVRKQRTYSKRMSAARKKKLDALGFPWNPFSKQWQEGYERLKTFREQHGHCIVPLRHITSEGYRLGSWVNKQRSERSDIGPDRKCLLDEIGFTWDLNTAKWEEGIRSLQKFIGEYSHSRVSETYKAPDGFPLGTWSSVQRANRDKLPPERRKRLDDLGFDWEILKSQWEDGYRHLASFVTEHGHSQVPLTYVSADGYRLGQWVHRQRHKQVDSARKSRLDALGFEWERPRDPWEKGIKELALYVQQNGQCRVPIGYLSSSGFRLGRWVSKQRMKRSKLTSQCQKRLDALGFDWEPFAKQWEEGFQHLKRYIESNTHSRVPQDYVTPEGYPLGNWVGVQRTGQKTLSAERRKRLEAIGFLWDVFSATWDEGFQHLTVFLSTHGHCKVPDRYVAADGFQLGRWVGKQRIKKNMSVERRIKLDALGLEWQPRVARWEEGISHLESFVQKHGHCRVPSSYVTENGFRLGRWLNNERSGQHAVSKARKARLKALGVM
jgi:superfamily II DNA or RNA helicase